MRFLAEGAFKLSAGISGKDEGWAGGPSGPRAQPVWWSGFWDFSACGGDLAQRFVDMLGLDGEASHCGRRRSSESIFLPMLHPHSSKDDIPDVEASIFSHAWTPRIASNSAFFLM